jgi:hypothetical protein
MLTCKFRSFSTLASSKVIKLLAVPEQVNIPLKICIERGIFKKYGLEVSYNEVKEGTGKMIRCLEEKQADLALVVTDALLVGLANGCSVNFVGTYVKSPLIWSIVGNTALDSFQRVNFNYFETLFHHFINIIHIYS